MATFRGITITQPFGVKDPSYRLGFHPGTDLSRKLGDKQPAYATGIARFQYAPPTKDPKARGGGYGNTGTITLPNGDVIFHSHLKDNGILVANGSKVTEGQDVFVTGDTGWINGIHEHVEYRLGGDIDRPVDITKKLGEYVDAKYKDIKDGYSIYKADVRAAKGGTVPAYFGWVLGWPKYKEWKRGDFQRQLAKGEHERAERLEKQLGEQVESSLLIKGSNLRVEKE